MRAFVSVCVCVCLRVLECASLYICFSAWFPVFVFLCAFLCVRLSSLCMCGSSIESCSDNFIFPIFCRLAKEIEMKEKVAAKKEKRQKNIAKSRRKDD